MEQKKLSVGVVIPTWRAEKHLSYCLPPLINSSLKPRILVIDSSSDDQTVKIAESYGIEVIIISKEEFNHGETREKARKYLGTDIVVMITQDAYAEGNMLEKLILPLVKNEASISYGRQIPHHGAQILEAFPRTFNYPEKSHIRSLADCSKFGVYTFFCSNSCAAYLNADLTKVGGFPHVLLGEDTLICAQMLMQGKRVAYVADAVVRHSHNYTLKEEFQRYFDTGYMRKQNNHLLSIAGKDSSRGNKFIIALMKEVYKNNPFLLPYAFMQTTIKYLGYQFGRIGFHAPKWFCKVFSTQSKYFN